MTQQRGKPGKGSICIVRHSFYPSELNVRREAEALLEDGYDVYVICLREDDQAARETIGGVHVRRLPVSHQRGKISRYLFEYNVFFILASFELLRLHVRHRLRAVQVNTMPDYLVFTTLIPRLTGTKVVLHMHEPMPELFGTIFEKWYHRPFIGALRLAERLSLAYADRTLTVTREMRENFGRHGADVSKITVVVNVPDDRLFLLDRYQYFVKQVTHIKNEERRKRIFRVLCHGTIEKRYGLDLIVHAMARLHEDIPGIQFRLMGRGNYIDELLALAEKLKVASHVRYLGFVPFQTMVEEILTADVTVVPMQRNPYSVLVHTNKMYEYMTLGRPIIASRLGSVAAYFPDDTLLYFEPGDDASLAEQLRHAFTHPEEMNRRIHRTNEIYLKYYWNREKKKYLTIYDEILGAETLRT